ncbi:hypothetical protein AAZV13_08G151400 [Glycine max]
MISCHRWFSPCSNLPPWILVMSTFATMGSCLVQIDLSSCVLSLFRSRDVQNLPPWVLIMSTSTIVCSLFVHISRCSCLPWFYPKKRLMMKCLTKGLNIWNCWQY